MDTFKKEKTSEERKGIIRKDWFTKILDKVFLLIIKNPEMIVMTFNCTTELGGIFGIISRKRGLVGPFKGDDKEDQ